MRVLVACEFSGVVREAFRSRGHDAWSCDVETAEDASEYHYPCDVRTLLDKSFMPNWDLMIAHPPCTRLCNSGVRWLYTGGSGAERDEQKWREMQGAAAFFEFFLRGKHKIKRVAVENPIMHRHAAELVNRPADQIIQPWQFGHGETKATCLWLKNLPLLVPTTVVDGRRPRVHHESPGPNRWKNRSRTYQGIADAMADQWGALAEKELAS